MNKNPYFILGLSVLLKRRDLLKSGVNVSYVEFLLQVIVKT